MKKFLSEFKEFALRGNVLDMAIGVVIGGAFGKITTSLVNDVIMPLVGMLIGGIFFGAVTDFGAYRRAGFREVRAQVTDIGGGYVMDDYVMELETTPQKE